MGKHLTHTKFGRKVYHALFIKPRKVGKHFYSNRFVTFIWTFEIDVDALIAGSSRAVLGQGCWTLFTMGLFGAAHNGGGGDCIYYIYIAFWYIIFLFFFCFSITAIYTRT